MLCLIHPVFLLYLLPGVSSSFSTVILSGEGFGITGSHDMDAFGGGRSFLKKKKKFKALIKNKWPIRNLINITGTDCIKPNYVT